MSCLTNVCFLSGIKYRAKVWPVKLLKHPSRCPFKCDGYVLVSSMVLLTPSQKFVDPNVNVLLNSICLVDPNRFIYQNDYLGFDSCLLVVFHIVFCISSCFYEHFVTQESVFSVISASRNYELQ